MATTPLYDIGNSIYIRESAVFGFLEAYRIDAVARSWNNSWIYTIIAAGSSPPPLFGERISYPHGRQLYFNESELISECDALNLAESSLTKQLAYIRSLRSKCL